MKNNVTSQGFTLIELSIVLVIVGLIIGGVLIGHDLISAAAVRAQITQIEKYNQAVNTFKGKFGGLPGDIDTVSATNFGFAPRGQYAGEGDGNGLLEGVNGNCSTCHYGYVQTTGENSMFWVDLSQVKLIDGTFNTASSTIPPGAAIPSTQLNNYFPPAKIGQGNYIYVYGTGTPGGSSLGVAGSYNYYAISAVAGIMTSPCGYCIYSTPALTVKQAFSIDTKMDDGLPQSGYVVAVYLNYNDGTTGPSWSYGGGTTAGANAFGFPTTSATQGTISTCYDNGFTNGNVQQYSITQNNGLGVNCALSFRFQ